MFSFCKWMCAETKSVGVWQRQSAFKAVAFKQKGKELILKSVSCLRRNDIRLGYVITENVKHTIYNTGGRTNSLFKTCLFSELNPYLKFAFKNNRFLCDTHRENNSEAPGLL